MAVTATCEASREKHAYTDDGNKDYWDDNSGKEPTVEVIAGAIVCGSDGGGWCSCCLLRPLLQCGEHVHFIVAPGGRQRDSACDCNRRGLLDACGSGGSRRLRRHAGRVVQHQFKSHCWLCLLQALIRRVC